MTEPWVPVPSSDDDGYHDPHPGRCPTCREILDVRPDGRGDCPEHGEVLAAYSFSETDEWEGRERSSEDG